jgi:hypothetical protein
MQKNTVRGVVSSLGGAAKVARALSVTPQAVYNWQGAKVFPAYTYVILKGMLMARFDTAPDKLWAKRKPHNGARR